MNNVVRTAIEALAAVLGGTNSLHTNALDEVLALPSTAAAETALRTQQVIMEETEVTNVADPLGGSWYVEALTDKMEAEAEEIFDRIRAMSPDGSMTGGILRGIENGWFTGEIADAAFEYQQKLEKGDKRIVGMTTHTDTVGSELGILRIEPPGGGARRGRHACRRRRVRDDAAVEPTLAALTAAAWTRRRPGRARAWPPPRPRCRALGEICGALPRRLGHLHRAPVLLAPSPASRAPSPVWVRRVGLQACAARSSEPQQVPAVSGTPVRSRRPDNGRSVPCHCPRPSHGLGSHGLGCRVLALGHP